MSFAHHLVLLARRIRKKTKRFINRHIGTIFVTGLLAAGITIGVLFMLILNTWQERHTVHDLGRTKYYTKYTVTDGDTLWDIAAGVVTANPEYPSVNEALWEIRNINKIQDNKILPGETVILPYYAFDESAYMAITKYNIDPLKFY